MTTTLRQGCVKVLDAGRAVRAKAVAALLWVTARVLPRCSPGGHAAHAGRRARRRNEGKERGVGQIGRTVGDC